MCYKDTDNTVNSDYSSTKWEQSHYPLKNDLTMYRQGFLPFLRKQSGLYNRVSSEWPCTVQSDYTFVCRVLSYHIGNRPQGQRANYKEFSQRYTKPWPSAEVRLLCCCAWQVCICVRPSTMDHFLWSNTFCTTRQNSLKYGHCACACVC